VVSSWHNRLAPGESTSGNRRKWAGVAPNTGLDVRGRKISLFSTKNRSLARLSSSLQRSAYEILSTDALKDELNYK
jgi:hypothetical protein